MNTEIALIKEQEWIHQAMVTLETFKVVMIGIMRSHHGWFTYEASLMKQESRIYYKVSALLERSRKNFEYKLNLNVTNTYSSVFASDVLP